MVTYCSSFSAGVDRVPVSAFAGGCVGFAGSRSLVLPPAFCSAVTAYFSRFGCCSGVDASFLSVLSTSYRSRSRFYRAYDTRSSCGLPVVFTASAPPRIATAVRTRTLVRSCALLVVCSPMPLGRGSSLAVRVARSAGVPAIVIAMH